MAREQRLLDPVLDAARRVGGVVLIGLRQRLPQPRHRPVQVLKLQLRRPVDDLVAHPAAGRAVGARDHDAVEHAGEDRALDVELEAPPRQQRVHDPLAAAAPPKLLEHQGGADMAHLGAVLAVVAPRLGGEHHDLLGEAAGGLHQPVEGAGFLEMVEAAQRCDDALADFLAVSVVLDDLDVCVGLADLGAAEHGASPSRHYISCPRPARIPRESRRLYRIFRPIRGTTYFAIRPPGRAKRRGILRFLPPPITKSEPKLLKMSQD